MFLQNFFDESNQKPNKIWVDKGNEFCNRSMKSWLEKNDIEMCSAHNKGRTLKNDAIVNKYNNIYHSTIKIKPVDGKSNTYIGSNKEITNKDPKFKIDDNEYQNIKTFLHKVLFQIGRKKFLLLKKLKILCHGHMLLMILIEKKLLENL